MDWKKDYELGIKSVDSQHKELIGIVNKFKSEISNKDMNQYREIGSILVYLADYTNRHFFDEESFMLQIGYPDLDNHKNIHREFVAQLRSILLKLKNHEAYRPIEFYYFLTNWLNDHILGCDLKIRDYYLKNVNRLNFEKIKIKNIKDLTDSFIKGFSKLNDKNLFYHNFFTGFDLEDRESRGNFLGALKYLDRERFIESSDIDKIFGILIEKKVVADSIVKEYNELILKI